ncbi:MAG: 4-hydroxy-tetrahydrodipicolinate synthase, partial [Proteobacteria bacterium]|nr:4-hydroxy-tetrahydrodipicolinate synthase [Pseudomonadota bacterium]
MSTFGHVVTAMVTPFDPQGRVDLEQAAALAQRLLSEGTDTLLVAGTTGESPTLTHDEKLSLFRAVKKAAGKAPVMAGTGSNDTAASVALTREAEACGVDGILVVNPYYNKPP